MRIHQLLALIGGVVSIALAGACDREPNGGPGAAGSASVTPSASTAVNAPLSPYAQRARDEKAKNLFVAWCSGCHGEHGRGDGPAAEVLVPKPRNFVVEKFKIRTTPTGKPPRRQDILDTVTRGLPGTAMPAFAFLSDEERNLIVDHVRSLAGLDKKPEPEVVKADGAAPANDAASIERGKAIYVKMGCSACHGEGGKGDGTASATLKDGYGRLIPARDYTKGQYLGGDTAADIRMRFLTGMDGTPMPAFADTLKGNDTWDLAHYILSLRIAKAAPPTDKVALGKQVTEEKQCSACHVLEGKGGLVGPSLDVIASKIRFEWVKSFLVDPLVKGKIYPYTKFRMPNLKLTPEQIEGVVYYLASISKRAYPEQAPSNPTFDKATIDKGTLLYFLKCTECHNLGTVIPTPLAKQQGPDLINVSQRLRFEFVAPWVKNPREFFPDTKMITTNLKPDEIDQVAAFVWSTSVANQGKK